MNPEGVKEAVALPFVYPFALAVTVPDPEEAVAWT
jgi:hypothetical protein